MGIRTPDLLHAISRQPVYPRTSPQVTVPTHAPECALVRPGRGTSVLCSLRLVTLATNLSRMSSIACPVNAA